MIDAWLRNKDSHRKDEPVEWENEATLSRKRVNSEAILIVMVDKKLCWFRDFEFGEEKRQTVTVIFENLKYVCVRSTISAVRFRYFG